ncbi:Dolichol kinase [Aphelenchoides besseyi]|nr:Dolichol kinase [Aphelenchoides besseyi]
MLGLFNEHLVVNDGNAKVNDFEPFGSVDLPYNRFDWTLLTTGWSMVILYGYVLRHVNRMEITKDHRPSLSGNVTNTNASRVANLLLGIHVLIGLILFAWRIEANPLAVPLLLIYRIFFTGGVVRSYLLVFWLLNVFATIGYCVRTAIHVKHISTAHRKFFHLTVSCVAATGFWYDPAFVVLCGNLIVQLFIMLEILRVNRVQPWASPLDQLLLPFLDDQDSNDLILTPIHLIGGIFLPTALELTFGSTADGAGFDLPRYFVGIVVVGVGDSAAAVVGSRFGRYHWGVNGRKTVEGSMAMFVAQMLTHGFFFGWTTTLFAPTVWLIYAFCTVVEAGLDRGDNIILPAIGYFAFRFSDLLFGT